MNATEEADLRLRAETAESLLAAEREENERLRAELAAALGQKPPEPKEAAPPWCEAMLRAEMDRQYYGRGLRRSPPITPDEAEYLNRLMRELMGTSPPPKAQIKVTVERHHTYQSYTVILRHRDYNVAFDVGDKWIRYQWDVDYITRAVDASVSRLIKETENRKATTEERTSTTRTVIDLINKQKGRRY